MDEKNIRPTKFDLIVEVSTWVIMIVVIFGFRFLPTKIINTDQVYLLIGAIVSVALFYYLLAYRYFTKKQRLYIKAIADVILISVLIHILKDYDQYLYALYFLPIAAAALTLEFFNALLIAAIACIIVIFEIVLGSQQLLPQTSLFFQGTWQIGLILFITIFCRFLAIQIKEEKSLKEDALAKQKLLEEETKRQKDFLNLTSHQLYTPLTISRGFAAMLSTEKLGTLNKEQKDAAEEIYLSDIRMVNLVEELLSISKIQNGKIQINKQITNLGEIVRNVVEQLKKINENKAITIGAEMPEDLASIQIDSDKIRQVLYNLISNALKYTEEGKVTVKVAQDEKETTVAVTDTGIGIASEDFEKLFEPFFRGKNILELDNRGTGLGLYIARLLVEKHGGKIWAESEGLNKGSRFVFTLPR